MPPTDSPHRITEHGPVEGGALRVQIERVDGAAMGWRELWEVFQAAYPGRWGVQLLPPVGRMLDQCNRYHVHVLAEAPVGMDLW